MQNQESLFSKPTLITLILSIIGVIGMYISPSNWSMILIILSFFIILLLVWEKISQIDENTENIHKLHEQLNIERRFNILEQQIYEQKGKINTLVNNNEKHS
jgi:c-di-AMP phosphodiesterase-like protein